LAILKPDELDIISNSMEQTQRLGARLGSLLRPGDLICLSGDMGAGKTVFTGGIGKGWGTKNPVTSPTYNLVHEHRRDKDKQRLYHLDCYRLRGSEDTYTIGFDDLIEGDDVIVLEWPERIQDVLPEERLWLHLRVVETNRRNLIFEGMGKRYKELIDKFRQTTFKV
jgi:tRNA threonylcarbamoyladenosine biosynthesis protein TsaE